MFLLALFACTDPQPVAAPVPPEADRAVDVHASVDGADPSTCAGCHAAIVEEWSTSMHGRAHASKDPIFAAMSELRAREEGPEVLKKCGACHRPLAVTEPDSPAALAGVACGACHPRTATGVSTEATCLTCHAAAKNPGGAPTCTTGTENAALGGPACASCHLTPAEAGHRSHTFAGPHRAWYQDDLSVLSAAVAVELERDGDTVTISVTNRTGHGFPSGFPGRVASIQVSAGDVTRQPEGLLFRKIYVDADDRPTLPPFAARLASDTRLSPGETRSATIDLPVDAGPITAELVFRLVPPPAVEALGLKGTVEAEPRAVEVARLP